MREGVLIAGGVFETAGIAAAQNIAAWDGTSWSVLPGGSCDAGVFALTVYDGDLVAGGDFTTAGGQTVNQIARWDGSDWDDLRGGMSGISWPQVTSLIVHDGELYAGGWFTEAGPVTVNYIARWDGEDWHALDGGMDMWVWALGSYHGDLIAGGDFLQAGGTPANYLARWDGTSWSAFGDGLDNWVRAIGAWGDHLYAGGTFRHAGDVPSYYLARWMDSTSGIAEGAIPARTLSFRAPAVARGALHFQFELPQDAPVHLTLHDATGRRIAALIDHPLTAGSHAVTFDGAGISSGVCFARLAAGSLRAERRMLYLK